MLYTQWNPIENIHKAIQVKRDAVSLTRPGHPDMAARLNTLFNSLFRRYELYGQACDIEEAVTIQEEANRCTPDDSMHKAGCLYGLGNVYRIRFRHLGQLSDIDKAVEIHERSVNMTPDTDTDNKVIRLVSLSDSLECRFDGLGSLRDIDRTISMTTLAAQITANGHVHRDRVLGALGGAFRKRFDHLRELDDIDKAISFLEQAANLASADDEDKPVRLDHLANAYQARFQRFKAPSDIDKAVTHHNDAVQLTSNSHPRKPTVLSNLGNSLVARFEHSSEKPDIDRATQAHRDALALMPEGHAARPSCLNNLSVALVRRFLKYDDIQDINEAIEALNESVRLTPPGHPERASHLLNLGHAVRLLFTKSGDVKDIRRASSVFSEAARSESGPPSTLFEAAIQWSKYAQEAGTSPLEAFRCAVDLLSRVAWMGMSVFDRYVELYELGGIVREAAGAAIASGEYGTAVEWLEQGRSIVWGQQLQLRAPVHELRDTYPELATELVQVSKALEAANGRDTVYDEDAPQKRHNLVLEWEALVEKVRKETELKDFLRPLKYTELSKAASDSGPVIIVNVCGSRCDALIVLSNGSEPLHVPLPEFSLDQATSLERSFHKVLVGSGVGATRGINSAWSDNPDFRFRNLLSSLWSWVVKPIIEDLQTTVSKRGLRRVWWCPTGVLSLLPLHAAGIYDSKSPGNNVSDFVVSSYTPTLSALINARRHRGNPSSPLKLLIVAHPGTPSAPIPNTEAELKYITKRCGRSIKRCGGKIHYTTLTGASASVPLVTQGMEQCGWIHLACHGVQNFQDPGKSALILTAPSDSTSNRLELSDIIRNPHPHATFAFLSACQTATGDSGLPDEVVHLASGMLVAGYGSVIATMWSIEDSDAPLVADSVYGDLFGKRHPDSTQAAFALHRAIKKLRDGGAPFLSWVPFIHLGD
ncbi:hypothetical protein JAAARDRAFT_124653 [Jaapia argillacea MUCL 33604]|uniref:CHAT domain-containing protein n=1 Tax=Jaapia argillacea MUCL 33604 TaxID=933084 RepID=A0A067QEP0_9AGAM|nr:hypothetical protein JAAARDRAFT_124653 [Jaapia argillacea MUCL 33604]